MAKTIERNIQFPVGGLDRAAPQQNQPPYTTPDALNVRPKDTLTQRYRGGSRPGSNRLFYEELGSGNPIRMVDSVRSTKNDGYTQDSDSFAGVSLADSWSLLSSHSDNLPRILPANLDDVVFDEDCGAVFDTRLVDTGEVYTVSIFIVPYADRHWGAYYLFAQLDNSSPDISDAGIIAAITLSGNDGAYTGSISRYSGGVQTATTAFTPSTSGASEAGWFTLEVNGTSVKCYWRGETMASVTYAALSGTRVGMGMTCATDGGLCLVEEFRTTYYSTSTFESKRNSVVASSNGSLYYEDGERRMQELSTSATLASDRTLQSASWRQLLFIADHGEVLELKSSATVVDDTPSGSSTITVDSTAGVSVHDHVAVLTNATGTVSAGTYKISAVLDGTNFTVTPAIGGGTATVSIERGCKVYDPSAGTLELLEATNGFVLANAPLIARYRERLVLGKSNSWFMSRLSDPYNWDYFSDPEDPLRAVGGVASDAGEIGDLLTAIAPHGDDYLIFGGAQSLWKMIGDPTYGGQIFDLSRDVGIVDKNAWCRGPLMGMVFLSHQGMYHLPYGSNAAPEPLSKNIPADLRNIDTSKFEVSMCYDPRENGVHVFLTDKEFSASKHWWFDWHSRSFWPVRFASKDSDPMTCMTYYSETSYERGVVLGCRDGYLRTFRGHYARDDGSAFDNYVVIGPFRPGRNRNNGILDSLTAIMGSNSGSVDWEVLVGDTVEECLSQTARYTGTWNFGRNHTDRPQAECEYFVLKIKGKDSAWQMEGLKVESTQFMRPGAKG